MRHVPFCSVLLAVYDDGTGPALYAGGGFGGTGAVARWDGHAWGSSVTLNNDLTALCVHGGSLYAAGRFDYVGSVQVQGLARRDASGWHAVADVPVSAVTAMASHSGALFIAGACPGGACVHALYGPSWFALPPLTSSAGSASVTALCSFDEDGPGPGAPVLYVSGEFDHAGSVPVQRLARWDGRQWSGAAVGLDAAARAFAPFGAGELVAGGGFRSAGGLDSWSLAGLTGCTGLCYANCDASTVAPFLNVGDFSCFLDRFASGDPYANCDASTVAPLLNVNDFVCFLNRFVSGCS